MTPDLTEMPTDDLWVGLDETLADIALCEEAITNGVLVYFGHSVQYRLEANLDIASAIRAELKRRGE